ncbi:hypothetical protein F5X96DRAFT_655136 [Biscogniauxia mediterranea]|nr:hypothetical protein F5X96DRAFT_655136 [Biscogniauxia mediterranea]
MKQKGHQRAFPSPHCSRLFLLSFSLSLSHLTTTNPPSSIFFSHPPFLHVFHSLDTNQRAAAHQVVSYYSSNLLF